MLERIDYPTLLITDVFLFCNLSESKNVSTKLIWNNFQNAMINFQHLDEFLFLDKFLRLCNIFLIILYIYTIYLLIREKFFNNKGTTDRSTKENYPKCLSQILHLYYSSINLCLRGNLNYSSSFLLTFETCTLLS